MTSGPPAAWYADPGGSGGLRYWDGNAWTDHVSPPPGQGPAQAGGYGYGSIVPTGPTDAPKGRRVWPWFVVIGVLFLAAVVAALAQAVPRLVDAGSRFTDEAAQSSAHLAADAAAEVYALDGTYVGATAERLEEAEPGLTFTNGLSTDFTTASVQGREDRFVAAVTSLTNRCYVVVLADEVAGPRTTGRLPAGMPCLAQMVDQQLLEPVDDF